MVPMLLVSSLTLLKQYFFLSMQAKSTLKVYQINTERLKTSVQDAVDENCHLQESEKQVGSS